MTTHHATPAETQTDAQRLQETRTAIAALHPAQDYPDTRGERTVYRQSYDGLLMTLDDHGAFTMAGQGVPGRRIRLSPRQTLALATF